MITLCLAFIYVIFLSYTYGWGAVSLLKKATRISTDQHIMICLIGLATITTLGSFFSIFFRINWEFQVLLLAGGIIIFILTKPYKNLDLDKLKPTTLFTWSAFVLIIIMTGIIIYMTSLIPANPDTGIYHAQTIHWIEDYPAIPGLANLHTRLGYNSSWLLLNAIFSFSYLGVQSFHFMTGFLIFIACLYFVSGTKNIIARESRVSDLLRIGSFLAVFIFLLEQASSPGTDAPSTLFEWILITETIRIFEKEKGLEPGEFWIIALLAVFTCTIKISAFPILLLAIPTLFSLLRKKPGKKPWGLLGILGLILLPFLIRNVIQTGYLVFPGPALDLFKFNWQVPVNIMADESRTIHWFAAMPRMDQSEFYALNALQWIPMWFANQLPRHKAILAAILVLAALFVALLPFKTWRQYLVSKKAVIFILLADYLGIVFWFLAAPAIRFGYGFLLGAILIEISLIIGLLIEKSKQLQSLLRIVLLPGLLITVFFGAYSIPNLSSPVDVALLPKDYPDWSTEPCSFGNFTILCQVNYDACWYSAFPCAIKGEKNIEMRGTDFKQGFRNLDNS